MSTNTNPSYPIGTFAEIGDDIETVEINPLLDPDADLTDEQYSYLRALQDLKKYTNTVTSDGSEQRAFVLSAIDYLKRSYKDEL